LVNRDNWELKTLSKGKQIDFFDDFDNYADEEKKVVAEEVKKMLLKKNIKHDFNSEDISKSLDALSQMVRMNKEIFDKINEWPDITGLTQKELDEMRDTEEVIELVRQGLTNGAKKSNKLKKEIEKAILGYFTLPSTTLTNTTKKILNNPSRIGSTRRGQINKMDNYLTKDSIITYKGNDSTLTFTLERTKELFTKKIQNGAKVFNFLLQKLNDQNRQEVTKFQLIDLVDNGIYANKDSAARGLKTVLDKMYAISIEGITTSYDGRKKEKKTFVKSRIISAFKVSYNECVVSMTPIIRESMPYITLLPNWSYTLNENSFMLLDYIFYLARQNAKQIKETGSFNISLDAIRIHLGLPTIEEAGSDPKRLIFEPIERAITEIEDGRQGTDIRMTPFYDTNYKHISEYLAGRLGIELDETARNYMDQRALAQEEEYKKEQKRAEQSKQKAVEKEVEKQL